MTPLYIRIRELIAEIDSPGDAIDMIIALERKFEMRGSTYTREDVNDRFRDHMSVYAEDARDMTEEEWLKFADGWLWTRGYSEVMGQDMLTAITDELYELKLIGEEK
jgi:hypothetical protein